MKLAKTLIVILKKIDFFGITFSFMINKETQYRTSFGGVLSIAISVIITLATLFYLNQATSRTMYTLDSIETMSNYTTPIFTNGRNFTISFSILNANGEILQDDKLFSLRLMYYSKKATSPFVIPLESCKEDTQYQCISSQFNSTLELNSMNALEDYSYLSIEVDLCQGKTKIGESCYSQEEMVKKLEGSSFVFRIPSISIDVNEEFNPVVNIIRTDYHNVYHGMSKSISYYFKNYIFISDNNMFYRDLQSSTYLTFDNVIETFRPFDSKSIFNIRIGSSNNSYTVRRQYFKLSQVFVNLGGLTSSLFLVGGIITKYINSIRMDLFIMNRLFDFVEDEEQFNQYKRKSDMRLVDEYVRSTMHESFRKRSSRPKDKDKDHNIEDNIEDKDNIEDNLDTGKPKDSLEMINLSPEREVKEDSNNQDNSMVNITVVKPRKQSSNENKKKNNSQIKIIKQKGKKTEDQTSDIETTKQKTEGKRQRKEPLKVTLLDNPERITYCDRPSYDDSNIQDKINRVDSSNIFNQQKEILAQNQSRSIPAMNRRSMTTIVPTPPFNRDNLCDDSEIDYEVIDKILEHEVKRNKKFTLSYSLIIKLILCSCCKNKNKNEKLKLYGKAEELMKSTFDVVEMYRRLQRMDGFISFFLSTKQLNLLNYLERPKVIFKNFGVKDNKKQMCNLIKCFNSYAELKTKTDNLINTKLLENFDSFIKENFDKMLSS